jgi:cyclopropane fatty-acyl-phospholipid synthase-like methyltransferase
MKANEYDRQLTEDEIRGKAHREFVGGLWDEIGKLQFEFMRSRGLEPQHRLLDIGCGALRGGVHFVRYLAPDRYFGLDINASLIDAGRRELHDAGLADRRARLEVSNRFDFPAFGAHFDYAIAISVFTHLPMNSIVRCLAEARDVLLPHGVLFASFFEAPAPAWLRPLRHEPGEITTHYDADPYHYAVAEMRHMAHVVGLRVESIGDWAHPRDQRMLAFSRDS